MASEHVADVDAVCVDAEPAKFVRTGTRPHLDDGHHAAQPAVDLDDAPPNL